MGAKNTKQCSLSLLRWPSEQKKVTYKKASYLAALATFSSHLVCDLGRDDCNLFRNPVFKQSNIVLDGVLKTKIANGEELAVEHKNQLPRTISRS